MLFLDVVNLSRAVEDHLFERHRIDWFRLAKHLTGPRRLVGAYVFDRAPDGDHGTPRRRFHDHLRYSGFRVVASPAHGDERNAQAEISLALATELLAAVHRDRLDVAVVVSGDRNLVVVLEGANRAGKIVEVAGMSNQLLPVLRKAADRLQVVDELPILEIVAEHAEARQIAEGEDPADALRLRSARELKRAATAPAEEREVEA